MAQFRLTLLGTFALSGGPCAMLSKKAQALLAFLASPPGQAHRRDKLASMLWSDRSEEAARQNLRQCLSAIRKVNETGEALPIIAEGDLLRLDPAKVTIDVCEFEHALRSREPEELGRAVALYRGELLEGLNLQGEPLEEWLIGERRRLRACAIEGLSQLLEHQQRSGAREEAMQTALRLLTIDPLQEGVHRSLMRLHHETGNTAQALRQYGICEKTLRRELNVEPEAATKELRREILRSRSASPRPAYEKSLGGPGHSGRLMVRRGVTRASALKQDVHYCVTSDGVRIAYAITGSGPPLVRMATWLTHLEHSFASPVSRHLYEELSREHALVHYDPRGNGLSDWDVQDLSLEAFVSDLEAVVAAANLDRFILYGTSQGAAFAAAYAAKHPKLVAGLILCNGHVRGWRKRLDPDEIERRKALSTLILRGWGQDNPAYRQIFSSLLIPDGTAEQMSWLNELERISTSPENAHRLLEALSDIDISGLLEKIEAPTLILHARDDAMAPFSQGQAYAAGIASARFVPLESRNHVLLPEEPAWRVFQAEVRAFLRQVSSPVDRSIHEKGAKPATQELRREGPLSGNPAAPHFDPDESPVRLASDREGSLPSGSEIMREVDAPVVPVDRPSLAVLPFLCKSDNPEHTCFADGLCEDIITTLSSIQLVMVIGRSSSFAYRGKEVDAKRVGRELGVGHVLEGSVRASGDSVRITAQLVDTSNGAQVWGDHYDRKFADAFAVQDEITQQIVTALEVKLTHGEWIRALRRDAVSPEAYRHYARAREEYMRFTRGGMARAREDLRKAIEINSRFAGAYVLLGFTHAEDARFQWGESRREALFKARDAGRRAFMLNASCTGGHFLLGYIAMLAHDFEQALIQTARDVAMHPSEAPAYHGLAMARIYNGEFAEGVRLEQRALRLDPLALENSLVDLGRAYFHLGRVEDAIPILQRVCRTKPNWLTAWTLLAGCYNEGGHPELGRQAAARILRIRPNFSIAWWADAQLYRRKEDLERHLSSLRSVGLPERPNAPTAQPPVSGGVGDFREDPGSVPLNSPPEPTGQQVPNAMKRAQEITFCRTEDGVSLAVGCAGRGSPLVGIPSWLSHLEYDWEGPIRGPLWHFLADRFRLVRYDGRGLGLSDRDVTELSFATFERDLEAVVDALNLRRYALLGISQGAATAIAHAVRYPERVSRMVLLGGFARGRNKRAEKDAILGKAFLDIMREGWGHEDLVLLGIISSLYYPGASAEQLKWHARLQRACASPETAVRLRSACDEVDIADLLPKVSIPTLVVHSRHDKAVPFDEGRRIAGSIKNAKFVGLEFREPRSTRRRASVACMPSGNGELPVRARRRLPAGKCRSVNPDLKVPFVSAEPVVGSFGW